MEAEKGYVEAAVSLLNSLEAMFRIAEDKAWEAKIGGSDLSGLELF